jgi:hypothetical protein
MYRPLPQQKNLGTIPGLFDYDFEDQIGVKQPVRFLVLCDQVTGVRRRHQIVDLPLIARPRLTISLTSTKWSGTL